jgi:anti-sigma-K factor RskA
MTREDFHAHALDYAAGAMTPAERSAFEAEIPAAIAQGWASDLAEAMDSAALLVRSLAPEQVRPQIWQAVTREMHGVQAKPRRPSLLWAAAVLLAAGAVGWQMRTLIHRRVDAEVALTRTTARYQNELGALRRERDDAKHARDEAERAVALAADAQTRVVMLEAHGTSLNARVLWNEAQHRGVVVASGPEAEHGKDYELWVIRGDKKIPAGLIHPSGGQAFAVLDTALIEPGADALAVTLEASGGAAQPEGPIILVGKI